MAPLDRPAHHARTLPALLEARARETPAKEALRFEGRSLTCEELRRRVAVVASDLLSLGVRPGDRVALVLPNGLAFPVAWLAVAHVRAVAVPISVQYKRLDLAYLLKHSRAVVAVAGKDQLALLEELEGECPSVTDVRALDETTFESTAGGLEAPLSPASSEPTDPVTIQYTSGTTGLPKGCVVDHGYWLRLARTVQEAAGLGPDDVLLTAQPQSYMDPSWNLVMGLMVGAPLVILPRFSASRFWAQAAESRATFFYCIGTMPLYLLKQPPDPEVDRGHEVRLVYCSGIPPTAHQEMEDRWGCPWRETYGTTELGVVLLVPPEDATSVGSGSMGRSVSERQVRVVDGSDATVGKGMTGELLVKGPDLMQGYFDDASATAEWLKDGWARTGDIVTWLPDGGFLHVGRKKDMIRRAGENVSAAEVEGVLVGHPAVGAAACLGVPDELRTEEVMAYVQLVDGAAPGGDAAQAIRSYVAERLARFKVPRYIQFVDELPLTQSGKVAKAELKAAREDHRPGAWDADSTIQKSDVT